jgi:hypothetical protein
MLPEITVRKPYLSLFILTNENDRTTTVQGPIVIDQRPLKVPETRYHCIYKKGPKSRRTQYLLSFITCQGFSNSHYEVYQPHMRMSADMTSMHISTACLKCIIVPN